MVLPAGFEPSITGLRDQSPNQLENGSLFMVLMGVGVAPTSILFTVFVCDGARGVGIRFNDNLISAGGYPANNLWDDLFTRTVFAGVDMNT